jgi:hypothetical protein
MFSLKVIDLCLYPLPSLSPVTSPSTPLSLALPLCYSTYNIMPIYLFLCYSRPLYVKVIDSKSRWIYILLLLSLCNGTSVHFLTSPILPYSPLAHMYFSHTAVPSPGTTLKGQRLSYSKSDDFPEVNLLIVIDFPPPPLLIP